MIIASAHHICDFTTSNFAKIRPKLHPNHSATTQNLRHCRRAAQIVKPASSTLWRVCICTGGKLQCHWIAIISSWICDLCRSGEASAVRYYPGNRAAHLARAPLSPLITSSTLAIGHDTILLEQGKPPAFHSSVFANYKYFWLKIVRQSHLPLLCPSIRKLCVYESPTQCAPRLMMMRWECWGAASWPVSSVSAPLRHWRLNFKRNPCSSLHPSTGPGCLAVVAEFKCYLAKMPFVLKISKSNILVSIQQRNCWKSHDWFEEHKHSV